MNQLTSAPAQPKRSLALFCKVVDNYGDIGICWRLARQLEREHSIAVRLWVDDLISFQRICPEVDTEAPTQEVQGVTVLHWRDQNGTFSAADIVIEFFGCNIPPGYIQAMAERTPRAVWLNLEGLTAEEWVEGCHTLPSPHSTLPLTKHFFFPGFNARTGGLLMEHGLEQQRAAFQRDPAAMQAFLGHLGVAPTEIDALKVSLFCYPQAPVAELFAVWKSAGRPITCLVPEGVAGNAVQAFLGQAALAGSHATQGALTVRVLPFVPQPDYDKLLWACDLNFVRGEDSFVRAQWAGKPFIWHIYPQDKNLHHVKLKAFLKVYGGATEALSRLALAWNEALPEIADWSQLWPALETDMPQIAARSMNWQAQMLANGDLASNLLKFAETVS
ncbi:elongation factor P maturation arginine rhamnosyltransferase EarP [Herbaspirillum lusitanum]|uniref:Protein-arginine rhamnosyltransferase n=1 Tax=Herbaspirillum lusitanum TaxID=213312 RepID=A0ABW9AAC5_9BURK